MAARRFCLRPGVALAELGEAWVAHSPLSNSSHVLNNECASIICALADHGAASSSEICTRLALEFDEDPGGIADIVDPLWDRLIELGLLDELLCPTLPSPNPSTISTPP